MQSKPVKVLCFFRAWTRVAGNPLSYIDTFVIKAERSIDIRRLFRIEMNRRISSENKIYFSNGPTPIVYELISYLPENGLSSFNIFRE
jgi:hypothetical protein